MYFYAWMLCSVIVTRYSQNKQTSSKQSQIQWQCIQNRIHRIQLCVIFTALPTIINVAEPSVQYALTAHPFLISFCWKKCDSSLKCNIQIIILDWQDYRWTKKLLQTRTEINKWDKNLCMIHSFPRSSFILPFGALSIKNKF